MTAPPLSVISLATVLIVVSRSRSNFAVKEARFALIRLLACLQNNSVKRRSCSAEGQPSDKDLLVLMEEEKL